MSTYNPINDDSIIESIAQQLTAKIFSGELKAGDRLPTERDLAEKLGVSRSSVHQAVMKLEGQGLLSVVPRRRTVVNDFRKRPTTQSLEALMNYTSIDLDKSLFSDMMDTRLWLESECARCACTNIYETTLLEMRQAVDAMKEPGADLPDLMYGFHYRLTQASGNSLYAMIFRGFEPVIRSLIERHYSLQLGDLQESVELRYRLLDAIERKDPSEASDLVCKIIKQGINVLSERYQ